MFKTSAQYQGPDVLMGNYEKDLADFLSIHQPIPMAIQRLLQPHGGGHQDVQLPSLDALQGADVQIRLLGQAFLGQASGNALAAHIGTESLQLSRQLSFYWHGALHRF
jgi:hypothetical protein